MTDDVKIHYNPLLANFGSWLTSLQSVGRNLTIDNNQSLQNLDGLVELKKVTLGMFITYNKVLTSIVGVSRAAVGSGLLILECDALTIIPVFTQISSFKGVLQVTECDALTSVAGFAGVTSLKSLVITRNKSLTSLAPFSTLTGSIGTNNIGSDHLAIGECPLLTDLTGLDNITAVGGQLAIDNNISLTNINALSKISTVVATVFITRNKVLQNVNGLSGLTSIGASLDISDNTALTSVTGLSNLTSLGGAYATLFVISNPALTSLQGLQNIDPTTIKDLYLRASPNLSVCELPNICTYLSNPANPSSIYGNAANCVSRAAIQAICPVPTTTSISGKVYREDNADIQNANLKLVGGSNVYTATTDINGDYTFSNIPIGTTYTLKVSKTNDSPLNGISIADMFKMMQHNLNITLLSSPYKMIAADVNNDGSIDATDMLHMQNFILSISQAIPAGGWIFIPSDYVFPNPTNPFSSNYPQSKTITLTSALSNINFIGLRRGDVNDTAITKP